MGKNALAAVEGLHVKNFVAFKWMIYLCMDEFLLLIRAEQGQIPKYHF